MIEPIVFLASKVVPKGWGHEYCIVNNERYCLKKLVFLKGKKMSNHFHFEKHETFHVESGRMLLRYFDLSDAEPIETEIKGGDIIHIPAGNPHQIEALEDSVIFEVSTHDDFLDNYRIAKGDSQT